MGVRTRSLKSAEFRREREASWTTLEERVLRIERFGVQSLPPGELVELPALHRAAVSSLSVARAISLDRALLEYLESLTARSYFCVYGTRRHLRGTLREFFLERFPGAVWSSRWHLALATLFLLLGVAAGFGLTLGDEDRYYSFVSPDTASGRDPTASTEELRDVLYDDDQTAGDTLTLFASFLFTHNAQVGIFCFALGFAAGLPVFVLLFYNGLILGAMAALHHTRGLSVDFWGWVMPHGVTELLAVVLCGAAGLVQAEALVFPGRHTRLGNLAIAGRRAGQIVLGCVVMLFAAALIEGYFRQLVDDIAVRYGLVVLTAVAWAMYFGVLGRRAALRRSAALHGRGEGGAR